jgi:hypothetical protein
MVEVKFKPHNNISYWHIINSPPKQNHINEDTIQNNFFLDFSRWLHKARTNVVEATLFK